MAKVAGSGPTPLDDAIAEFLSRIAAEGKPLNYIGSYSFDRSLDAPYSVTIKFYADEELQQFGKSKDETLSG